MPLTKAIEFSSLAGQLLPSERVSFVKDVALCHPEMMIDALSSYFTHIASNHKNVRLNNQFIKSIATIIQSRDSQSESDEDTPMTFDALPRRLIGVCSSFLDQKSYSQLSSVNREVFLGCNTPIMLHEIKVAFDLPSDHKSFDFSAFPFARKLNLDVLPIDGDDDEDECPESVARMNLIASQICEMPRLVSLECNSASMIRIIANSDTTNQRTRFLSVDVWADDQEEFNRYISSMSSFKHIEFLKFNFQEMPEPSTSAVDMVIQPLIEMCSNLKGLNLNGDEFNIELAVLTEIGHNLQYLKLNKVDNMQVSQQLKDVDFTNLRQLVQGDDCYNNVMRIVLRTAVNLEKVKIRSHWWEDSDDNQESHEGDGLMLIEEIFGLCEQLRYVEIYKDDFERTLEAVASGLSKMKQEKRGNLKIKFITDKSVECMEDSCYRTLVQIVGALCSTKLDHWMIILPVKEGERHIKTLKQEIQSVKLNVAIYHDAEGFHYKDECIYRGNKSSQSCIVISHAGCNINGYHESWLM